MPAAGPARPGGLTALTGSGRAEVRLRGETARPVTAARAQSSRARVTAGYLGLRPRHCPPGPRLLFAGPLHQPGLRGTQDFPARDLSRGAGAEARLGIRGGRRDGEGKADRARGTGGGWSRGFQGRAAPPSPPPLLPFRTRGAGGVWSKRCCSGTMTLARFAVALIFGALPGVVSFDPVLSYPLGPQYPYYLPTQQRPQKTPLPRVPRPPAALRTLRLQALHARHTPGPRAGDCPAGEPWVNVTDFGASCLRWAEVPPFLERSPPAGWAQLRGQSHNFCRSPDGTGRPWCFYGNAHGKVDWGYCDCRHGEWPRGSGGDLDWRGATLARRGH